MIERQFISRKIKEFEVYQKLSSQFNKAGYSKIIIKRTPLGEKIIVSTTRPGLIVGKKGENITRLTDLLKKEFKMENPQIEVSEIENPSLDPAAIAEKIKSVLENYGSKRFKAIGHSALQEMMSAGAFGAEVVISGKVPSARAKSWRFKEGHLKKSGDIGQNHILIAYASAKLKSGIVGIRVSLMHPSIRLPDKVFPRVAPAETAEKQKQDVVENKEKEIEIKQEKEEKEQPAEKKDETKKKATKRKPRSKKKETEKKPEGETHGNPAE